MGKKDGSLQPCIECGPLDDITIKNQYPLSLMASASDQLQQANIFTKVDLRNAYQLVRIHERNEWKTGFNTPSGHFKYRYMSFGLTNAPVVFQAVNNDVLRDFLNHFVCVYNILIFSLTQTFMFTMYVRFSSGCWGTKCMLKLKKVTSMPTVCFFDFTIAPGKIHLDLAKVSTVA